jgi:phosphoglycerate kinase
MKKTIVDHSLNGRKVIIRCDLNVPMENGVITDETRIVESLETIKFASSAGAKVIIMSHLGRVKTEEDKTTNSLLPVSKRLSELLKQEVKFIPQTRGMELELSINAMENGDILMMENTRFEDLDGEKESKCDEELSKYWASLGEVFINDAFGTAHRKHASNVGIASNLPNGIGFLIKKELDTLGSAISNPKRPLVIILGGKKVADKLAVIEHAAKIADYILIGGGMSYTFFKALGYNIGASIVDDASLDFCKKIYEENKDKIILPLDIVVGTSFTNETNARLIDVKNIGNNDMGLDIGIATINNFKKILMEAKTVIWNGPVGVFELEKFSTGTRKMCEILAEIKANVIIGGGDSAAAVTKFGFKDKYSHISTGGGASLEMLEGKELPGIAVIWEK